MTRSAHSVTMLEDGEAGDHMPLLRAEVERLQTELQEASQQNEQAARYGLAMLEESAALKSRHSQLEEEHEALKQEVQQLREVRVLPYIPLCSIFRTGSCIAYPRAVGGVHPTQ